MSVTVTAPAKVNLTLEVGARRADGYHEMKSVMQAVDLCDTVTLTATPNDGYRFVRWSNDVEDNPYTFVISENIMLSAEFTIEQTAVENITTNENIQKILRNGQLLILRDGKTYTIMGAEVK